MKILIKSLCIILIGLITYYLISTALNKTLTNKNISNKKKTIIKLINSIIRYVLLIIVVLIILQINGINVTSIIAGLGIVSLVAGLALQDALKDIIMGFNLIFDNYFSVGDVIEINNITGKVLELGIKATKIKDIYTNSILTIANRNIDQAIVVSDWLDIDLPLPYEKDIKEIEKTINKIITKCSNIDKIKKIEYKGLQEFDSSSINYKIRIYVNPEYRPEILRQVNKEIKIILDKDNLSVPYTQIRLK